MSFNNYVDADAAWQLVSDFDELACAIIKHTNPAGVALGASAEDAYRRALATDPLSAFGGVVAFNRPVDEAAARARGIFTEVITLPGTRSALEVLRTKEPACPARGWLIRDWVWSTSKFPAACWCKRATPINCNRQTESCYQA